MPGTKTKKKAGVMHSVYFPTQGALDYVRRAAKKKGIKLSVFMRDACNAAARQTIGAA